MRRTVLLTLSIVAGVTLMSCQQQANQPTTNENKMAAASPEAPKKTAAYDPEAVSNRIITQVAGVKENDVVFINGGVRDFELLEDLNIDSRKVGAFPLLGVSSDRMVKKYYEEVPEKYDTQSPDLDLKLATLPNVAITVDSNESEGVLSEISPRV